MGVGRDHHDTIVAIASPSGSAVRGIVRVSGPRSVEFLDHVFSPDEPAIKFDQLSEPASFSGCLISDTARIPGQLLLWPTRKSYTRQPSAEFHTIGSRPILESVVKAICNAGARPAEPGEFTMRAFLSGRIDLTQAEAILALIDSKNRKQLDTAIDQLAGGIGKQLTDVRSELVAALAELEAGLDFVEEDIEFISNDAMIGKLKAALNSLSGLRSQLASRDRKSNSFKVSLFGLPNAGKSSLFNRLVGRDAAIVSSTQGTTTDRVTATCRFGDQTVELADTAGLESDIKSDSSIRAAAQQHRVEEIERCDLSLLCVSMAQPRSEIITQLEQVKELGEAVIVLTQSDLLDSAQIGSLKYLVSLRFENTDGVVTSSVENRGTDTLKKIIEQKAVDSQTGESAIVGSTMLRTGQSLTEASASIESAIEAATLGLGDEIVASEVRSALDSIGLIVGTIYTDDILDVVFGQFCIGK